MRPGTLKWRQKQERGLRLMQRRRDLRAPSLDELEAALLERPVPDDPDDLSAYAFRLLSQHGEAGIVYEALRRAGAPNRTGVEIGCGANGGNAGLLPVLGFRCLMVDGNPELTEIAAKLFASFDVTVVTTWITRGDLNQLLEDHGFTGEIDYLGIDVDGVDYWLWEGLSAVSPRLVVCEYNPIWGFEEAATVPYADDFNRRTVTRARKGPKCYYGASLPALTALGKRRGYRLVATCSCNAFFLRDDLCPEFRALTPAEAWVPRTKGDSMELYEAIRSQGLLKFHEDAGFPLVEVA